MKAITRFGIVGTALVAGALAVAMVAAAMTTGKTHDMDQTEAVDVAIRYIGLDALRDSLAPILVDRGASMETVSDTVTPFLSLNINGKRAWVVSIDSVPIPTRGSQVDYSDARRFSLDIWIDSSSGVLLKIRAVAEGQPSLPARRTSLSTAEEQLGSMLNEVYVEFAESPPTMTMLKALGDHTYPPFELCGEADILYVMHSYDGAEAKPAWVVHMYDLPPDPDGIDHMRNVIDAATGVRVVTVNMPMPWVKDLKKTEPE